MNFEALVLGKWLKKLNVKAWAQKTATHFVNNTTLLDYWICSLLRTKTTRLE